MKIKGEYRDVLSRNGAVIVDTGWKSNDIVADYGRFLAALMKKNFEKKVGIEYMAVGSGSKDDAKFKSRVKDFFNSKKPDQLPKPTSKDNWVWAKKIEVGDIKYLNPYLFSIEDGALKEELNGGIIPEELKEKFRTKGIPLSETTTITKETEDKWVITDEEKSYFIRKEGVKLDIYLNPEDKEVDTVTNRLKIDVTFGEKEPSGDSFKFKEFALLGIDKNPDDTFDTEKMFFINYIDHGVITKDEKMVLTRSIKLTFPVEGKEEVVS